MLLIVCSCFAESFFLVNKCRSRKPFAFCRSFRFPYNLIMTIGVMVPMMPIVI